MDVYIFIVALIIVLIIVNDLLVIELLLLLAVRLRRRHLVLLVLFLLLVLQLLLLLHLGLLHGDLLLKCDVRGFLFRKELLDLLNFARLGSFGRLTGVATHIMFGGALRSIALALIDIATVISWALTWLRGSDTFRRLVTTSLSERLSSTYYRTRRSEFPDT